MRCRTAIGVDDDLASGQAGITIRTADFERTGRIDVILRLTQQDRRDNFGNHPLHIGFEFRILGRISVIAGQAIAGLVLGRYDHGGRGDRQTAFITQGYLALGVGLKERRRA